MAARALIIAIENYDQVADSSMAKVLPGTLQTGLSMRSWLQASWQAAGRPLEDTQILFCSEPPQPVIGGTGASLNDIKRAMQRLQQDGRDVTEELYVFFSGHGFLLEQDTDRSDFVVTSDFESMSLSGQCCLKVDFLVAWLSAHLGAGRHVHFIDACRNILDPSLIAAANGMPLPWNPSGAGRASSFVLQSTAPGATAAVAGPFPTALLAGLKGAGVAKVWDDRYEDGMIVQFDSLSRQIRASMAGQKLTQSTRGDLVPTDCILTVLRPVPQIAVTVEIQGAVPASVNGTLQIKRGRSSGLEKRAIDAALTKLTFEPDRYALALRVDGIAVEPEKPVPVELYDDKELVFTVRSIMAQAAESDEAEPSGLESMREFDPESSPRRGRWVTTKSMREISDPFREQSESVRQPALDLSDFELPPATPDAPGLTSVSDESVLQRAVAARLETNSGIALPLDSPFLDPDLDICLAAIGGGRILGAGHATEIFHGVPALPLQPIEAQPCGASPIYLLAGLERGRKVQAGLASSNTIAWRTMAAIGALPGLRELLLPAEPGGQFVAIQVGEDSPIMLATYASPGRATLITLTSDDHGQRIGQFHLPMGHLRSAVTPAACDPATELALVAMQARAIRALRRSGSVQSVVSAEEMIAVLNRGWLEPILACLAGYEGLRRRRETVRSEALAILTRSFPNLPDIAALSPTHSAAPVQAGVPLFLEGVLSDTGWHPQLPLPLALLDSFDLWTRWRLPSSLLRTRRPAEPERR